MIDHSRPYLSRRAFLRWCAAAPAPFILAACAGEQAGPATPPAIAQAPTPPPTAPPAQPSSTAVVPPAVAPSPSAAASPPSLQPTPACEDGDEPTLAQTEGPYFTPNSPERASLLEASIVGTRIVLTGTVLSTGCAPVARALLDFWHADDSGAYDNVGYRLRGHQFSDDQGRYSLETVVPGLYPGRTRHFHVKVQAPDQPVLTTQLYFPDEPDNDGDGIFRPELLMDVRDADDGKAALFDFVLAF
jgi:protocatechuate 3,4-dioxygenase beta subunit